MVDGVKNEPEKSGNIARTTCPALVKKTNNCYLGQKDTIAPSVMDSLSPVSAAAPAGRAPRDSSGLPASGVVQDCTSHRILRNMYEILNVVKKYN